MKPESDQIAFHAGPPMTKRGNLILHPAMEGSYSQRMGRAQAKEEALLSFLASGEVCTTAEIAGALLYCSKETARRLLVKLVSRGLLKRDEIQTVGGVIHLFGLTSLGLASSLDGHTDCPIYEMGRTSSQLLHHHLDTQAVRIVLEDYFDWTDWIPEKILQVQECPSDRRGKKYPDGIGVNKDGEKIAVEIERTIKFGGEWEATLVSHWMAMRDGKYSKVIYFTDQLPQLWKQFRIIKEINLPFIQPIDFQKLWQTKFSIFSLSAVRKMAFEGMPDDGIKPYVMPESSDSKITPHVVISRSSLP